MNQLVLDIFSNDNLLNDSYYKQDQLDINFVVWLKSFKSNKLPKKMITFLHIFRENQALLLYVISSQKLGCLIINMQNLSIQDDFIFTSDQKLSIDLNSLHPQSIFVYDKIYLFLNRNKNELVHILIVDLENKALLPIENDQTFPSCYRIQYSLALYSDYRILMFGGLDDQLKLLDNLDIYDISTYQFQNRPTKGQSPSPRHSHQAQTTSQYMIILGGSTCTSPFEREQGILSDCYLLDLNTWNWTSVKIQGTIPRMTAFGSLIKITSKQFLYLYEEKGNLSVSQLNIGQQITMKSIKQPNEPNLTPQYRYQSTVCLDKYLNSLYVFGGFLFGPNEPQALSNCLDRLLIQIEGNEISLADIEVYNGKKFSKSFFEQKPIKQQEDNPSSQDELSFEELLEQEKRLQQEEDKNKSEKNKKKKQKRKKTKSTQQQ